MDALDRVIAPATELLASVDEQLVDGGVPDHHPIWPLLRRLHALPGDAVAWVAGLRPTPLAVAAEEVHALSGEYTEAHATLAGGSGWQGSAANAFHTRRAALARQLADGPESLTGRLTATADYAQALAVWVADGRIALARTLAEVLGSAEAVTVLAGTADTPAGPTATVPSRPRSVTSPGSVLAAATIGARVLATVAELHTAGEALLRRWAPTLARLADPRLAAPDQPAESMIRLPR